MNMGPAVSYEFSTVYAGMGPQTPINFYAEGDYKALFDATVSMGTRGFKFNVFRYFSNSGRAQLSKVTMEQHRYAKATLETVRPVTYRGKRIRSLTLT